ncbi:MAG: peptide deformylase [bacterium]|nr:peptide deformylase [bacterium]
MAILELVLYPDPTLKEPCSTVTVVNDEIRALLSDMAETMYAEEGIGLAAPQIGSDHRVIVVDVEQRRKSDNHSQELSSLLKLINPEIVSSSGKIKSEEGCLSIPGVRETIERHETVVVRALDERGDSIEISADGLLAICLQHEIDHLDGILFIDHLTRLRRNLIKQKLKQLTDDYQQIR